MILNEYNSLLREYFDFSDRPTTKFLKYVNESDQQSQLLAALAGALYEKIVDKCDKIDFGSIPRSRGDITKVDGFNSTVECVNIIRRLVVEYKEDPSIVDIEVTAIENMKALRPVFIKGFNNNASFPMMYYNIMVASIQHSVSYLIAVAIQFVKDPDNKNIHMALDKAAYRDSESNMILEQLAQMNKAYASGNLEKLLRESISGVRESVENDEFTQDTISTTDDVTKAIEDAPEAETTGLADEELSEAVNLGIYNIQEAKFNFFPKFLEDPKYKKLKEAAKEAEDLLNDHGIDPEKGANKAFTLILRVFDIFQNIRSAIAPIATVATATQFVGYHDGWGAILVPVTFIGGIIYYLVTRLLSWGFKSGQEALTEKRVNEIIRKLSKLRDDTKDKREKEEIQKVIDKCRTRLNDVRNSDSDKKEEKSIDEADILDIAAGDVPVDDDVPAAEEESPFSDDETPDELSAGANNPDTIPGDEVEPTPTMPINGDCASGAGSGCSGKGSELSVDEKSGSVVKGSYHKHPSANAGYGGTPTNEASFKDTIKNLANKDTVIKITNKVSSVADAQGAGGKLKAIWKLIPGSDVVKGIGFSVAALFFLIKVVIPALRNAVAYFWVGVADLSESLSAQANLIELNALDLEMNSNSKLSDDKKAKTVEKQMKVAQKLRSWSQKIAIKDKKLAKDAKKAIDDENKKNKFSDIKDGLPSGMDYDEALF